MSDTPCPKCGSGTDDIGGKLVCSECYWVFDRAPGSAARYEAPTAAQKPQAVPQAAPQAQPQVAKDASAPLVMSQAPAADLPPMPCPKCGSGTDDIDGKLVCSECYWVFDRPGFTAQRPTAAQKPQAAPLVAPQAAPQVAPQAVKDANAPLVVSQASAPALTPMPCPKCSSETTDVGGRLVCSKCYWVIDQANPVRRPEVVLSDQSAEGTNQAGMTLAVIVIVMIVLVAVVALLLFRPH